MVKSFFCLSTALTGVVSGSQHLRERALKPDDVVSSGSLVKPLKFNQPLLLCNAYESKSVVASSRNGQTIVPNLPFQTCKYADANVLAKDKIDFVMADAGIEGTFEVGDLPQTDSVLLLVLQRRDAKSPLMAFQSFAFPVNGNKDQAHVAVIDATADGRKAHLQIGDRPLQGDVHRVEELSFNRVYALEQGAYDISVLEQGQQTSGNQEVELLGAKDYVLMRTSAGDAGTSALVAFPNDPVQHSGSSRRMVALSMAIAILSVAFTA